MTRSLIVGWFSFAGMGATAGDLMAAEVARRWLHETGRIVQVAALPCFPGDIDLAAVNPSDVDELVFVCGPFGNGWPITELLERFAHCRLVGLDVSLLQSLDEWNPFDVLFERESDRRLRPDLSLLADQPLVPLIGLVEVHPQSEYGDSGRHAQVGRLIRAALAATEGAVFLIDTALEANAGALRSAAEVESAIAKCDVVVTTRLHGMALALKHGVPAVVVDPIAGGAKVARQAAVLGWPHVILPEEVSVAVLTQSIAACLTEEARALARACAQLARARLEGVHLQFRDALEER